MEAGSSSVMVIPVVIWLIISLSFAIPTGISASRRSINAVGWGILTFFTWLAGLIVFLLFAKPKSDEVTCAACGEHIPRIHTYCPFCGHRNNNQGLKGE